MRYITKCAVPVEEYDDLNAKNMHQHYKTATDSTVMSSNLEITQAVSFCLNSGVSQYNKALFSCAGANVNHRSNDGSTPLIEASPRGDLKLANTLIAAGEMNH